jgi:hypothetical protein
VLATSRGSHRYLATILLVGAALLLVAGAWVGLHFIPASVGYTVEAEFASLPADDHELEAWLKTEPGVVPHTVYVWRKKAAPKVVVVDFTMVKSEWGSPPFPDLEAACERLGYRGRVGKFKDRPRE